MLLKPKGGDLSQVEEGFLEGVTEKLVLKIQWLGVWRKHPMSPIILLLS